MKNNLLKLIIIATGIFATMFLFRLIYGYIDPGYTLDRNLMDNFQRESDAEFSSKLNIATKKMIYESKGGEARSLDQKYEKIATIESATSRIEEDEKKVRESVESSGSIIQYENTSGLKTRKNRIVKLVIGVPPEKFDGFVDQIKKIGKATMINIDKRDKTNEYKDLQAKKESLLKIRASLIALKNKGGRIDEYINLENRILEIEEKIQKLGISLGEFDSENEFCTVKLTLSEGRTANNISLIHRIKVALEWTIKYYFLLAIGFFLFIITLNIALKTFNRYKGLLVKDNDA